MKPIIAILACAVVLISSAHASEPGQPLDCSDWVFLEPGLACQQVGAYPCGGHGDCVVSHDVKAMDNQGMMLSVRETVLPVPPYCAGQACHRLELVRSDGVNTQVLATITERGLLSGERADNISAYHAMLLHPACWRGDCYGHMNLSRAHVLFDPVNGALLVTTSVYCTNNPGSCPRQCDYPGAPTCPPLYWPLRVFKITGFTRLFDIMQTYTPQPPRFGFRVPAHPEGLRAADRFDTYWGRVSDLPDFTQAQPMACAYPSDHQPQAGEYLTVADTSPRPAPGAANYIVTAASDGAQRRYGRQRVGASLTGRDPALLPSCP